MKSILALLLLTLSISLASVAQKPVSETRDVTVTWVKQNLRNNGPKLILTAESLAQIKKAVKKDETAKAYYGYLYKNAVALLDVAVLERKLEGRRLLGVSRQAIARIGTLAAVYAISKEKRFLDRVNTELLNVCNFSDWNPSHFLDVGEMAYGVSIGLDWTLGDLPESTIRLVKDALISKAIEPSLNEKFNGWVKVDNNWNQVCHGGITSAAVMIADQDPALAAQLISRMIQNIPRALRAYGPDGAYPEGASYWSYGTSYTLITINVLESAFGTDFGISNTPGFVNSALFVKKLVGSSGLYFNYFDSGSSGDDGLENQELLLWFANRTNNDVYFDKEKFLGALARSATSGYNSSKFNGMVLAWLAKHKKSMGNQLPANYKGDGINPIVVFGGGKTDPNGYFLGAKGGAANLNHGNMDAGSFVFDLYGVRWSVDLGMQNYFELEQAIGVNGLWDSNQQSKRWTLLSKNNFGHSTLTVNDELHLAKGFAPLSYYKGKGNRPQAGFDLSAVFKGQLKSAKRDFKRTGDQSLEITDILELSEQTKSVTWAMMTQADAEIIEGGVLLKQKGKTLKVMIKQPEGVLIMVVSENPPPLDYDMKVENLKRVEFKFPVELLKNKGQKIVVELKGS
ncbi:heparinase II/III family protein [Pedobacter panaciterrae]|jgi:Heparinase II/III-like protein.|uniref:heparinase II/III domain-containing protein n=1 Tax=Pedobacter panaciterrae TaxID=363849 RepID=UPI00155D8FBA|nr:heparinase II/III family protein [Pedobacter panaciterrae]NQX56097.1 heparinase II/III family protein [Pedobacter panaciterrae]